LKASRFGYWFSIVGPGIAIAATGVGAGDLVAAAVAGARYGPVILWAAVFGALLKYVLNEGIARWQLATDTTLIEGWVERLHPAVGVVFSGYLLLWSFIVAGALSAACGLAGEALFGGFSEKIWGVIHSLVAFGLVWTGRYSRFEQLMKGLIAPMFLVIIGCALLLRPDWPALVSGLTIPRVPTGSGAFILGVVGGVGGSVTLLSYGYWIREKSWYGSEAGKAVRVDLGTAYILTGLFGVAMMIIAGKVDVEAIRGTGIILALAHQLETALGGWAQTVFLVGFWCAVFTSMLGVWQGVPYLFTDFIQTLRRSGRQEKSKPVSTTDPVYRGYLCYLAFPPLILLLVEKPVWIIVIYSVTGALFMPFLAGTLLILNNRHEIVGTRRNTRLTNILLSISLAVFGYLAIDGILSRL
jgi:Mn2+/Fe2+ NRAMP family transporter